MLARRFSIFVYVCECFGVVFLLECLPLWVLEPDAETEIAEFGADQYTDWWYVCHCFCSACRVCTLHTAERPPIHWEVGHVCTNKINELTKSQCTTPDDAYETDMNENGTLAAWYHGDQHNEEWTSFIDIETGFCVPKRAKDTHRITASVWYKRRQSIRMLCAGICYSVILCISVSRKGL